VLMKDIYYKGYRLYCIEKDEQFICEVLGRDRAKYKGRGTTKEEAISKLKLEIDRVR